MSNMSRTLKEAIKEELLTCGVCMELFVDPKILPCLHTFCDECLQSIYQNEINTRGRHTLTCPTCRCSIQGVSYEDLNLKSNFNIKNLLETIQSSPNNESFTELYRVKEGLNLDLQQVIAIAEKNQSRYLLTHNHEMASTISDLRKQLYELDLKHQRVVNEGIETQIKLLEKQKLEHQKVVKEATEMQKKLEWSLRKTQIESSMNTSLTDQIAVSQTRTSTKSKEQKEESQTRTNANFREKDQVIQDLCNVNDGLRDKYRKLKRDNTTSHTASDANTNERLEEVVEKFRKVPFLHWFVNYNTGTGVERTQATGSWFWRWLTGKR